MTAAGNPFDKSQESEQMLEQGIRLSGESREWFMVECVRDLQTQLPEALREAARPQGAGESYTTPTIWRYLRIVRQHRRLRRLAAA